MLEPTVNFRWHKFGHDEWIHGPAVPVLQQQWFDRSNMSYEWVGVPTVVEGRVDVCSETTEIPPARSSSSVSGEPTLDQVLNPDSGLESWVEDLCFVSISAGWVKHRLGELLIKAKSDKIPDSFVVELEQILNMAETYAQRKYDRNLQTNNPLSIGQSVRLIGCHRVGVVTEIRENTYAVTWSEPTKTSEHYFRQLVPRDLLNV